MNGHLTIVNWNVDSGGQVLDVIYALEKHTPDICILTEFRAKTVSGSEIKEKLHKQLKLTYQVESSNSFDNGVFIASNHPIELQNDKDIINEEYRGLLISAKTHGINFVGVFCKNKQATDYIFSYLRNLPKEYLLELKFRS